ncbi:helix-turn-helix domain-containing protein [uncultured Shewanella sp.]|uniref:helix-turn-helix domain-containing protein n=1 Tax=uncultured Shewanella sp. TaxID=173975 RepID=UPI0026041C71|nr:helix-turn-helix domain-containing protein [uncultured Shewanella sp.]
MQALGKRVKQKRIQLGYQAKYVAKEVGLSPGGLSLFENGHTSGVDFVTGVKLAKLLQISPEALALGYESNIPPARTDTLAIIGCHHSGPESLWLELAVEERPLTTEIVDCQFVHDQTHYGLRITENTGRYLEGEVAILNADPQQVLISGNDVYVVYQTHRQLMHFLYERGGKVHLIGFEKESHLLVVNRNECQYLHSVVAIVGSESVRKR